MPTVNIDIEIEVCCASCGAGLCGNTEVKRIFTRGADCFEVYPCEKCLEVAKSERYEEGYKEGSEQKD